jgi:putative ABC transport system permease protein
MSTGYIEISLWQLAIALALVVVAGIASMVYELRLQKDLALGTLRTFAQLFAMGYLLKIIFQLNSLWLVLAVYLCMIYFSVRIIKGRVKEKRVNFLVPTMVSVTISYSLVTYLVTGLIIGANPWWTPQYFIPIGGMVAGNSMNALAIGLERFFSELRTRKDEVEMMLCLGADFREASKEMFRNALKAGMIPSINSMMGVGIVSLPGMMTGQILAGADPVDAVRYQIVVMLMIVAATVLSSLLVLHLVRRRCFGPAMNLLLRDE